MSRLNPAAQKREDTTKHLNWMGGPSYDVKDPLLRLRIAASSCFFGEPQYYAREEGDGPKKAMKVSGPVRQSSLTDAQLDHLRNELNALDPREWRGKTPAEILEATIDEALAKDPGKTLAFAAELRQALDIRTTPQVIMARAAKHPAVKGTNFIAAYAPEILNRMDEPAVQMAYYLAKFGKPIPSVLKRAWARRLQKAKPLELAKYRQEGREVNLFDVVNVCHAKGEHIDKLMKGQLKLGEENKTWESVRSGQGGWKEATKVMGHMALLRNLRNLESAKELTDELLERLVKTAEKGRQLPFRYYTAYRELQAASARATVLDAIELCLEQSIGNLPHFKGRVMSLVDNSGSAHGTTTSTMGTMTIAGIGNLMGVLTARTSDEGWVGVFGDRLQRLEMRKKSSIFDSLKAVEDAGAGIGGGTEHGIWMFWDQAIRKKEHWDHVFVYSDMQAGHGGLYGTSGYPIFPGSGRYIDVPMLVKEYRKKVNPKVMVYLVQIAGYTDTLFPEFYDRTFILGGWSEQILRFADAMTRSFNQ